ncbi:MAG: phage holin family protein [Burkholderiales bacterium]
MLRLITRWLLLAAALLAIEHLYDGLTVNGFTSAMVAALLLGLLNAVVRPLLVILTLPVTLLTLGLFLFVINAAMFYVAAWLLEGVQVSSFGAALLASLMYSLCAMVIDLALNQIFRDSDVIVR